MFDVSEFDKNPLSNAIFRSSFEPETTKNNFYLGIDEAGRGPVLGPMVYSAFFCDENQTELLKELGCADSKQLTEERRSTIFSDYDQHKSHLGFVVKVLSPHVISGCMLRREKYNLNDISHDAALELIKLVVDRKINVKKVFVDTVGDPDKYAKKIRDRFPKIEVTVSKKADSIYPIVSASSICAKVIRDQIVENWKFSEFDEDQMPKQFGSGYPGDPQTKRFLNETIDKVFGFSKIVRFSWSTASTMIESKCYKVNWDDDEPENLGSTNSKKRKSQIEENSSNKKTLLNYFGQKNSTKIESAARRTGGSEFFRSAQLKSSILKNSFVQIEKKK